MAVKLLDGTHEANAFLLKEPFQRLLEYFIEKGTWNVNQANALK